MASKLVKRSSGLAFKHAVVSAMQKLYPLEYADKSWDNVGLLVDSQISVNDNNASRKVLLTIDLTSSVTDEAIQENVSMIIAYHPIIFRGLRQLSWQNPQQASIMRLVARGISVYCPHTAVDNSPGGLWDWLADIVTARIKLPDSTRSSTLNKPSTLNARILTFRLGQPSPHSLYHTLDLAAEPHDREHVKGECNERKSDQYVNLASLRIIRFKQGQPLHEILERLCIGLGRYADGFALALPANATSVDTVTIHTVSLCAGSGGSLLSTTRTDLLVTGEMSHHEALAAVERNSCVVTFFHSNTERGYLKHVLQARLTQALANSYHDEQFSVNVSRTDKDPFTTVTLE